MSGVKQQQVRAATAALIVLGLSPGACNGDDAGRFGPDGGAIGCLDPLPLDCNPTFPPSYDAIYANLLSQTCGAPGTGGSCHGPNGRQAGLLLLGEDEAYAHLLGDADDRARVIPGDPECSLLMQRLESRDPEFVMPVGMRLSEEDRCAVRRWIASGAAR